MTIFYLDPESGNDANDGLSFANRWRTLKYGPTAVRTSPGDTVRIIASPDPASLGAVQWTDGSPVLTPAVSRNKVIDEGEEGWTGAPNVTASTSSSSTVTKTGPSVIGITPVTAFTTGKMAYKTLAAPLDLSAFQQISLYILSTSTTGMDNLTLHLCSDTVGDVPLASFVIGDRITANNWEVEVLDYGSALPSGINSISISTSTDPATATVRLQNIVACKAPGAEAISHLTLIGKMTGGEPEWYPIGKITDTTIAIGASEPCMYASDPVRPYRGTTESVVTYKRDCITQTWTVTDRSMDCSGSDGSPITFSAGWDRVAMATQSGETWISASFKSSNFLSANYTHEFLHFEKLGLAHFTASVFAELCHGWQVDLVGIVACTTAFSGDSVPLFPSRAKAKCAQIWGCHDKVLSSVSIATDFEIGRIHGSCDTASVTQLIAGSQFAGVNDRPSVMKIGRIDNNAGAVLAPLGVDIKIIGATFENNELDVYSGSSSTGGRILLEGCSAPAGLSIGTASGSGPNNGDAYLVKETRIGGVPWHYRTRFAGGYWESTQAVAHTPGGVSLAVCPTNTRWSPFLPVRAPLAKVAVQANKLVTVKAWVRRDNVGISAGLEIEDLHPGLTATRVLMTAAADTWEELEITFTPTIAGVVDIFGAAYGGTTYTAYFADLTISQAD